MSDLTPWIKEVSVVVSEKNKERDNNLAPTPKDVKYDLGSIWKKKKKAQKTVING